MKIANYNIRQKSSHQLDKRKEVTEKLEAWTGQRRTAKEEPTFLLDIGGARKTCEFTTDKTYLNESDTQKDVNDPEMDVKLKLIESFIYMTTGKRVRLKSLKPGLDKNALRDATPGISVQITDAQPRDGWGLVYEFHEVSKERENLHFHSAGSVQTSDGRLISFDLDFNMSRAYYKEKNLSLRFGDAKMDPLVISLKGGVPELSAERQVFGLDGDGDMEDIAFATGDSGFVALDKNGGGVIDDGTELSGPETGDGFAELAAYDLDNNGWIDENDEVFGKLSIMALGENGEKTFFKLGEAGVGAIYLSEISTQFEIRDGLEAYGEMKSSSIYLNEDGTPGTIHHMDLTV